MQPVIGAAVDKPCCITARYFAADMYNTATLYSEEAGAAAAVLALLAGGWYLLTRESA